MLRADISGKRALVTGGASGIGLATVEALASSGATVAVNYLPGDPDVAARLERLKDAGLKVVGAPGDVSQPRAAEEMVERAIAEMGGLDYLVNNAGTAGTSRPIPADDLDALTEEFWLKLMQTNLFGPFWCSRAASSALREAKGAIVNTASIAGLGGQGSSSAYSASKSGLVSLTRSLARGLGPDVRVNAVAPGLVNSPWTESWPEERKEWARDRSVLGRITEPKDVAEVILFLCAGASNITGQVIVVDGGLTL